jgi:seryl-tRNA synthetase
MLDPYLLRERPDDVAKALKKRGLTSGLDEFAALDAKRRALLTETESLKRQRNESSKKIGEIMKAKGDATALREETKALGDKIAAMEADLGTLDTEVQRYVERLPNLPHESVPEGTSADDNVVVRTWGTPRKFEFDPQAHWDLGRGARHPRLRARGADDRRPLRAADGDGARLERALINFMLDLHGKEHGYTEVLPPFMVNATSLFGTGQLPKFEEDLLQGRAGRLLPRPDRRGPRHEHPRDRDP